MYLDVATLERRDGGLARHRDAYQARDDTRTETIGESTMGAGFDESIGARIATVLVERDHREWLAHRWERSHGRDEAGHVPSDWRSGELARFSEIFPHAWDLVIRLRGAHYLVEDMYCLTPDCRCASIAAQFVELVGSKDCGVARAALPALIVEKGPDRARLQELLDAVPRAKIRERYRRVRGFAEDREHRAPPAEGSPTLSGLVLLAQIDGLNPPVWRRVEMRGEPTLAAMANAIANAMGWAVPSEIAIREATDLAAFRGSLSLELDQRETLPSGERTRLQLSFGKHWIVHVAVERIGPVDSAASHPRVIDGEGAAPPERCRGPRDYYELLDAFEDPDHPDHEARVALLGESFHPDFVRGSRAFPATDRSRDKPVTTAGLEEMLDRRLLMNRTWDAIMELADAGPALVALIERSTGEPSWSVVHAVRLLGGLELNDAVAPLIRLLRRIPGDSPLGLDIANALSGIVALDGVLEELPRTKDVHHAHLLRTAIAGMGILDERAYEVLLDAFMASEQGAADNLARYGDARALEPLTAELQILIRFAPNLDLDAAYVLVGAIESLGGRVAPQDLDALAVRSKKAPLKLGRNDICWCGSGKKYKKCHLSKDEEDEKRVKL